MISANFTSKTDRLQYAPDAWITLNVSFVSYIEIVSYRISKQSVYKKRTRAYINDFNFYMAIFIGEIG